MLCATICCAIALCFAIEPSVAVAQELAVVPQPGSGGRLWNISDGSLKYRLRRATGATWTEELTLAPGEFQQLRLPKPGERAELAGLDVRDPHVSIEYPALGGVMRFRLPARSSTGAFNPFWFYVKDSNGIGHLIQARERKEAQTVEDRLKDAQATQERFKAAPPLKPEEIEQLKATLYVNWVFHPARQGGAPTGPGTAPLLRAGARCHW